MEEEGVPGSLRRLLSSYVRGRSAYVQAEDGRGQAFECSSGVVFSADEFVIVVNW